MCCLISQILQARGFEVSGAKLSIEHFSLLFLVCDQLYFMLYFGRHRARCVLLWCGILQRQQAVCVTDKSLQEVTLSGNFGNEKHCFFRFHCVLVD